MLRHIPFLWGFQRFPVYLFLSYCTNHVTMLWKLRLYEYDVETYHSWGAFKDPYSTSLYCVTMVRMVWKLWCRDTYRSCGAFKDPHAAGPQTVVQLLHEPFLDVIRLKGEWKLVWNSFTFSLWKWKVEYIIHASQCLQLYLTLVSN